LTISRRATINWLLLIYFTSGVCSLMDEVVWVRLLKLTFGHTVYASSVVVSVFMGGLALGALVMSRYSDQIRRPLRLYALLEALITVSALLLPLGLQVVDALYVWLYRAFTPGAVPLLIVQITMSSLLLLVPTMLMGSTLPLLGRFVATVEHEAGHLVGRLYALNTLGAAIGCFLAGFLLIRAFGVMGTLYAAAGLNLVVVAGGWILAKFQRPGAEEPDTHAEPALPLPAVGPKIATPNADTRFYWLVIAFFASGLMSIGYEILWMRSVIHLLGGATYVFSSVLTVYLLGNVIGAGIGSRLIGRLRQPPVGFATILAVLGLCGVLYPSLLIYWTSELLPPVNQMLNSLYPIFPTTHHILNPLIQCAFMFLVPSTIMGIGFPIAVQALADHMHGVGRSTGVAYGANTIGAVVGGIATGFILIPAFGLQLGMFIIALGGLWIAAGLRLLFAQKESRVAPRWTLAAVAAVSTLYIALSPFDLFERVINKATLRESSELVTVREGVTTTVSLHRNLKNQSLTIRSSGQVIAGDAGYARGDQKVLGHFGVLLNKEAKSALSVGFGSGETTACLARHRLDRVDCVEIAPEIVDISIKHFSHINLGQRLNDEVRMIYMDAKNYLHLTDTKYDVIVNDSIHPRHFAENASLYGKEYFESARERLNENGIIMSWIPTYNMPRPVFESIVGTLMEVFPHVTVWHLAAYPVPMVVLIGSNEQQYFSPEHIDAELQKTRVSRSLAEVDVDNSLDVMNCYIGDEVDLRPAVGDFHINSDYEPYVEFDTDYFIDSDYYPFVEWTKDTWKPSKQRFVIDVREDSFASHIDWSGFDGKAQQHWLKRYNRRYERYPRYGLRFM